MKFSLPEINFSEIMYTIKENKKKMIIIGGTAAVLLVGAVVGIKYYKAYKQAQAEANIDWSLKGVSAAELVGGQYYIKDGDIFYPVAPGLMYSSNEKDTPIPKAASPTERIIMFWKDDQQIPTLYRDCELIYKDADYNNAEGGVSSFPPSFYLERFKDEGYTIGVRGLSSDGTKYHTEVSNVTFYPKSDAQNQLSVKNGQDLTIDKINGMPVSDQNVSTVGTILGLNNGSTYKVDAYVGTSFVGGDILADTHMMSSYELYELKDYNLTQDGYAVIPIPDYMWSGYYNINGSGVFRFVNGFKDQGYDDTLDFNVPYLIGTDDQGNLLTSPATPAKKPGTVSEDTVVPVEEDESGFVWNYDFTIDNQQKEMSIQVEYSDASAIVDGEIKKASDGIRIPGASTPQAILISPSGRQYQMTPKGAEEISAQSAVVSEEDEGNTNTSVVDEEDTSDQLGAALKAVIKDPETGTWHIKMSGFYARTFNVSTSYTGASTNMIVKDGDKASQMTVYLPTDVQNAEISFVWEDTNHAGTFIIRGDGNDNICSNERDKNTGEYLYPDAMIDETYGRVVMNPGFLHAGEYVVDITGESLGHVYFSYKDLGADETVSDNEAVSENEAPSEEPAEEVVEELDPHDK